jgi:putative transposase
VTIATEHRRSALVDPIFVGLVASIFETRAVEMDVGLDLYCLMPDHAHFLIQVKSCGVVEYMQDVKSRTTKEWWLLGEHGHLWQRSFHDRGLRTRADYDAAVSYVLQNPVIAGLCDNWGKFDGIGGTLIRPLGTTR